VSQWRVPWWTWCPWWTCHPWYLRCWCSGVPASWGWCRSPAPTLYTCW